MSALVFCLEERSAREMLQGILPKITTRELEIQYIVFEGKQDLEKRLPLRMRAWRRPDTRFIVLRDQDSGDCKKIKSRLLELCKKAGREDALVRIACKELESWYLGDLKAVEKGLEINNLAKNQQKTLYRNPDAIANAAEQIRKLTAGRYQKIGGSRSIGSFMNLESNTSRSFQVFVLGIKKVIEELSE